MKNIKPPAQLKAILAKVKPLGRHHYFIFLLLLLVGLTWTIYTVNQTLSVGVDQGYKDQKIQESLRASFDQATVEKIDALQRSNESSTAPVTSQPGARTNPFAE